MQAKIAERRKIAEEKDKEEAVMREKIRLVLIKNVVRFKIRFT